MSSSTILSLAYEPLNWNFSPFSASLCNFFPVCLTGLRDQSSSSGRLGDASLPSIVIYDGLSSLESVCNLLSFPLDAEGFESSIDVSSTNLLR